MKVLLSKFSRGAIYLFTLKLSLLLIIFTVASCQQEDDVPEQENLEAITEFSDFVKNGFSNNMIRSEANLENAALTEESAKVMLESMSEMSMEFLIKLGFEENEINEELGGMDSPQTMAVALLLLDELSKSQAITKNHFDVSSLLFFQAQAYPGDVLPCLGEAFGFAAVGYILSEGIEAAIEHYGTKGLMKVLGKAAGRTLGWVGAALAAYEFAQCLRH